MKVVQKTAVLTEVRHGLDCSSLESVVVLLFTLASAPARLATDRIDLPFEHVDQEYGQVQWTHHKGAQRKGHNQVGEEKHDTLPSVLFLVFNFLFTFVHFAIFVCLFLHFLLFDALLDVGRI
jgi:hypothetical protein